jgi:hypothetical protein
MSNQTTGSADASGEREPDFQKKYDGLNAVLQRKTNEWSAKEAAWETERQELAAKAAKAAEYEEREATARAEAEELAEYERLRERFEQEPPAPQLPGESSYAGRQGDAGWQDRYPRRAADKAPKDAGWPI